MFQRKDIRQFTGVYAINKFFVFLNSEINNRDEGREKQEHTGAKNVEATGELGTHRPPSDDLTQMLRQLLLMLRLKAMCSRGSLREKDPCDCIASLPNSGPTVSPVCCMGGLPVKASNAAHRALE